MDQFERDEAALERELDEGRITSKEFDREIRMLRDTYREAAEEEARRAQFDAEMQRDAFGEA